MAIKKRKRKHELPEGDINITSLMDILTTLLFFILMVMSLQKFSIIDSTSLSAGEPSKEEKPVFTLQVTLMSEKSLSIWLGPTKGLEKKISEPSQFKKFLKRNFKGSKSDGYTKVVRAKNFEALLDKAQKYLIGIKKGFPAEMKAVISFTDKIKYQQMINAIGSMRELGPTKEGFIYRNIAREREKTKVLFPQVIIAEESEGA